MASWYVSVTAIRGNINTDLIGRAKVVARALDASIEIKLALQLGGSGQAKALLEQLLAADSDLLYIVILDADRKAVVLASRVARGIDSLRSPVEQAQVIRAHSTEVVVDEVVRVTVPLSQVSKAEELTEEDRLLLGVEADKKVQKAGSAVALVGFTPENQVARTRTVVRNALVVSGLVVTALLWVLLSRVFRRIGRLRTYAATLAAGNLSERLQDSSSDEIGDLARALESITHNLGETISRVRVASIELGSMSGQVHGAAVEIAENATTQSKSVKETGEEMATMSDVGAKVETQILLGSGAAERSADQVREISTTIEHCMTAMHQVSSAAEEAQGLLNSTLSALGEVDRAVDRLNNAAENTATATTQITASIHAVDTTANKALTTASRAVQRATSGVKAVDETREGIQAIREFAASAVESIRFLSEKVISIEKILDVIAEITNQTRLLSLNASIIAAQAGEHGRGFLVVADEIKALAAKTAGSTSEIGGVIRDVLDVSGKTIDVVEKGVHTVEEAMVRSDHASAVLSEISKASTDTGGLMRSIASAMSEQAKGAERVDLAMQEVHNTAVGLREIVSSQIAASRKLQEGMASMRAVMKRSIESSGEQVSQVDAVLAALASLFAQIHLISEMNQRQGTSRERVARAFGTLARLSDQHRQSAKRLSTAVEQATAQSAALAESVEFFQV